MKLNFILCVNFMCRHLIGRGNFTSWDVHRFAKIMIGSESLRF